MIYKKLIYLLLVLLCAFVTFAFTLQGLDGSAMQGGSPKMQSQIVVEPPVGFSVIRNDGSKVLRNDSSDILRN